MLSVDMSPVQWTDRRPPALTAGGIDPILEQEAAGSNPVNPDQKRSSQRVLSAARMASKIV
jgi:hypothetical protein